MTGPSKKRIVIDTGPRPPTRRPRRHQAAPPREWLVTISVIAAAALATFLALFITSRPYDPMDATIEPQQQVPASGLQVLASPKPSAAASATPPPVVTQASPVEADTAPDDSTIQTEIENRIASDPLLTGLDISTLVEKGKVSIFGSVKSQELKTRVERLVRGITGVSAVDNQLVVTEPDSDL